LQDARVAPAQIYPSNCWNNTLRINNRTAEQMQLASSADIPADIRLVFTSDGVGVGVGVVVGVVKALMT